MDKQLDRAKGELVGLAVGDALGAPIEFSSRDSLPPVIGYRAGGPARAATTSTRTPRATGR